MFTKASGSPSLPGTCGAGGWAPHFYKPVGKSCLQGWDGGRGLEPQVSGKWGVRQWVVQPAQDSGQQELIPWRHPHARDTPVLRAFCWGAGTV